MTSHPTLEERLNDKFPAMARAGELKDDCIYRFDQYVNNKSALLSFIESELSSSATKIREEEREEVCELVTYWAKNRQDDEVCEDHLDVDQARCGTCIEVRARHNVLEDLKDYLALLPSEGESKEMICKECGKDSTPTYTHTPLVVPGLKDPLTFASDYKLDLCDECMAKGWTDNPEEVRQGILKDPVLKDKIYHRIDPLGDTNTPQGNEQ